jgi:hypothetical protein
MQDRVSFDVDIVWEYIVLKYYIELNLLTIWSNQKSGICDSVANFYVMKL